MCVPAGHCKAVNLGHLLFGGHIARSGTKLAGLVGKRSNRSIPDDRARLVDTGQERRARKAPFTESLAFHESRTVIQARVTA
jgi:hypothetical protein